MGDQGYSTEDDTCKDAPTEVTCSEGYAYDPVQKECLMAAPFGTQDDVYGYCDDNGGGYIIFDLWDDSELINIKNHILADTSNSMRTF